MKLREFAELMGVSLEEAEKLLKHDEVITINLSKEEAIKKKKKDELVVINA